MERDFEDYNKDIEEFDARNVFEYDSLKELNRDRTPKINEEQKFKAKRIELYKEEKKRSLTFN
jgi:nitrate/TMAO reductase-like tetraheme cytochrome c subunit